MARPAKSIKSKTGTITKAEEKARTKVETRLRGTDDKLHPPDYLTEEQKRIFLYILEKILFLSRTSILFSSALSRKIMPPSFARIFLFMPVPPSKGEPYTYQSLSINLIIGLSSLIICTFSAPNFFIHSFVCVDLPTPESAEKRYALPL